MPEIPGLHGPIQYERDQWGYPTLEVEDLVEGAYARGYMHAKDRLVQIQLLLMMAQGRLMEVAGDSPLTRMLDRAIRTLNFTGDLTQQVAQLDKEGRKLLQAYCEGFNACLKRRRRPLILKALGISLTPHSLARVILLYRFTSYFGLTSMHQLAEGVIAGLVADKMDEKLFEILLGKQAKGLDLASLETMVMPRPEHFLLPPMAGGSNAFAVASERTASGSPMLLSEFHLEVGRIPPAMYAITTIFRSGGYYQGIGIAGLAWLSAGRTQDIGWTYTFGHADNIDIIVERCEDEKYLADGEWKPLRRRIEKVKIRGKREPESWTFYDNAYGSVMGDASTPGDYPCIRWSGLRDCSATDINAARSSMEAPDVATFLETHRDIRMISLSAVVVDTQNNIGYIQTGQVDQRPEGWTGAYPRKAWDIPDRSPEPLPESTRLAYTNPPEGYIASANEARERPPGAEWITLPEVEYRYRRICELLEESEHVGLNRMIEVCYDEVDLCARDLMPLWEPLLPNHPRLRDLCKWSTTQEQYEKSVHREYMGLFHAFHNEVAKLLLEPYMGAEKTHRFLEEMGLMLYFQNSMDSVLRLEHPHLLDEEGLQSILHRAWPVAVQRFEEGEWHLPLNESFLHILFQDTLPSFLGFSTPPMDIPGGPTVPFQSRILHLQNEKLHIGPLFHMIFDMSQPGGWYNFAGGASEDRWGPGYAKGLDAWREGRFSLLGSSKLYRS